MKNQKLSQGLKGILSDKLLWWAIRLLPPGSDDRKDLAEVVSGYLGRAISRGGCKP